MYIAQDASLEDFFHILEWYWTELRVDPAPDDGEMLMLEDGSVNDPYVDDEAEDDDGALDAVMDAPGEPAALDGPPEPEAPTPEDPPSPSEPSSSLPPLQAPPGEPTRDKLDNIPAPPSTWGNPDENLELVPPASESSWHTLSSPGKIAEVAVSTPAGSLGEPAPSTPEQRPKLQKLPQFVIPGPEHERDLLKAQMDQQIAALRPGLGLERYCKRSNYISARGTNWP